MAPQKNTQLRDMFEALREKYGDHSAVARALGIAPAQYRTIRRKASTSASTIRLMEHLLDNKEAHTLGHLALVLGEASGLIEMEIQQAGTDCPDLEKALAFLGGACAQLRIMCHEHYNNAKENATPTGRGQ